MQGAGGILDFAAVVVTSCRKPRVSRLICPWHADTHFGHLGSDLAAVVGRSKCYAAGAIGLYPGIASCFSPQRARKVTGLEIPANGEKL